MNESFFQRSRLLVGDQVMQSLASKRVIIFGVGGVGSWCAESLIRSGVRYLDIVDYDDVCPSNINRQVMATSSTVGKQKVEVLRNRLLDINPDAKIGAIAHLFNEDTKEQFDLDRYDYIIDCIDSLKDKILLSVEATRHRAVFFSSMGSALKLDFTNIRVAEFWQVDGCPLGSAMRKRMRQRKMFPSKKYLCIFSPEVLDNKGIQSPATEQNPTHPQKAQINGTMAHITAIFGFALAGLVVQDVAK
ncbi:MAG: tRNA threonylcarbamoyladenosine dehydratase [Porphyromonadaceae bacterium]|nr:tRNA threonylcarbamoyladenosine dehydratase [Porphyromonadaceae bacterium]